MIRLAKQADVERIGQLLYQINDVHALARPDLFKLGGRKMDEESVAQLIDNPKTPIFVYEDGDGVLGHMFLKIKDEPENDNSYARKTLFIDDLCVDEKARGKKIGQQFLSFAKDFAKEEGCSALTLHVFNSNEKALAFYQRLGMRPLFTEMEWPLD